MNHIGEPITRGRRDLRAVEARARADGLFAVALFVGVVLINGILVIVLIEVFQSIGWWELPTTTEDQARDELSVRLRMMSVGRHLTPAA